ncbi:hypothetical protein ACQ4PT_008856 [Festuca glaucescens]
MEALPSYAEDIDGGGSSVSMLLAVASSRKITIVGGSIPEKASGKLFNTESDTFAAGQEPTVVDTDVGRIGIGICHDIRFPELALLYRARLREVCFTIVVRAHLICYPSAFNMSTGQLLWDLMQKSRFHNLSFPAFLIDNQLFVATCSPARDPNSHSEYMIWDHSSLIGPFGEVLAAAGHEEATVIGEIDLSLIEAVRENIPLEMQRRGDLYRLVDVQKEYYAS